LDGYLPQPTVSVFKQCSAPSETGERSVVVKHRSCYRKTLNVEQKRWKIASLLQGGCIRHEYNSALPIYRNGKKIPLKFLDPYRDPDQHQNLITWCYHTSHPTQKFINIRQRFALSW